MFLLYLGFFIMGGLYVSCVFVDLHIFCRSVGVFYREGLANIVR